MLKFRFLMTPLAGATLVLALAAAGSVQAATEGPLRSAGSASLLGPAAPGLNLTQSVTVDVSGIVSYAEYGVPGNTVLTYNVGANTLVTGIGWDVTLTAYTPSWLSELSVSFEDSAQTTGVFLAPGTDNTPGAGVSYTSGTVLQLADYGLEFNVGADGVLRLEFFEDFSDGLLPDGLWNSGTLTIETVSVVPEPATYGLMGLGLLGVLGAARRRRGH